MAAPKGTRPPAAGRGRPKGSTNKISADVKAMILAALDGAGGVEYLTRQAEKSPAAFMTLLGKVLPMQISGQDNEPLTVVRVRWEGADRLVTTGERVETLNRMPPGPDPGTGGVSTCPPNAICREDRPTNLD